MTAAKSNKTQKASVVREEFLTALEMVRPGVAEREHIDQSSCFVFRDGEVTTYNGDVSCTTSSGLPDDFLAVVPAARLLEVLKRKKDEIVKLAHSGGRLAFSAGKGASRWNAGFRTEAEVRLPLQDVPKPDPSAWKALPPDFVEAMHRAKECASRDDRAKEAVKCVNVTPDWVEACDLISACRWVTETGFSRDTLIRREGAAGIAHVGATHFAESDGWVHFANRNGTVLSCRRYDDPFPSETLTAMFEEQGVPVSFPKDVAEAVEQAGLFSKDNPDDNLVQVELEKGCVTVSGEDVSGNWFSQTNEIDWKGQAALFYLSPELLAKLLDSYSTVAVGDRQLSVRAGNYRYITSLMTGDDAPTADREEEADESDD